MWEMVVASVRLFFAGKLFQDPGAVARQSALGAAVAAVIALGLVWAGLPIPLAAGLAGVAGGALQPFLFKDLKYR